MTPLVRTAAAEEVESIRALMRTVIDHTLEPAHRAHMLENVNSNVDVWLRRQSDCVHLVAIVEDQIVGVILIKDFWNLCSLFVAPSHQGSGIGRALVEQASALCKARNPKETILLNAAPSAIGFYVAWASRTESRSKLCRLGSKPCACRCELGEA